MSKSESIKELATALAKAQGMMKGALKDSANPFFKSKYADLASVVEAIRVPLANNGLSYVQISHERENAAAVETLILHSSGEWMSAGIVSAPVTKADAQGHGSCLTYCRRYSLSAAFGVTPEDDDGNAASAASNVPKAKAFEAPHKPTDGANAALSADMQTVIHDLSNRVRSLASKGDIKGCCDEVDEGLIGYVDGTAQEDNNELKLALWERLADVSAVRSAMKKEWASRQQPVKPDFTVPKGVQ